MKSNQPIDVWISPEGKITLDAVGYRDTVPHLLDHNAVLLLANGEKVKIGTVAKNAPFPRIRRNPAE